MQLYSRVVACVVVAGHVVFAGWLRKYALVNVELARGSLPGWWTKAAVVVDAIDAGTSVEARLRGALVDVGGAQRPGESLGAVAEGLLLLRVVEIGG